jgi:hypothetical protein
MHKFEITDSKQARRFRRTQFNGRSAKYLIGGTTIKGFVVSVFEQESATPACWTVTIVPEADPVRRNVRK